MFHDFLHIIVLPGLIAGVYYSIKGIRWFYRHKHPAYAVALWFVINMPLIGLFFYGFLGVKSSIIFGLSLAPIYPFIYVIENFVTGRGWSAGFFAACIIGAILVNVILFVMIVFHIIRTQFTKWRSAKKNAI